MKKSQDISNQSKIGALKSSERLTFNRLSTNDFQTFFEIYADPNTNIFNPDGAMNKKEAEEFFKFKMDHWDKYNFGTWTIREKEEPKVIIGFGGLNYRVYGDIIRLNLGYRFPRQYWGRGYATEFAKTTIQFGFEELKADEIFALVRPKNLASIRVLEKCKMDVFDTLNDVPNEENSIIYRIKKNHSK